MNADVLRVLRALAQGARLVWRNYMVFGFAFWTLEGSEWSDGVNDDIATTLRDGGYLAVELSLNDKHAYVISAQGRAALADAVNAEARER